MSPPFKPACQAYNTQRGQALAEALLVCVLLLTLLAAGAWLFRARHVALQAQHASAHTVFLASRQLPASGQHTLNDQYRVPGLRLTSAAQIRYLLASQLGTHGSQVYQADVTVSLARPFSGPGMLHQFAQPQPGQPGGSPLALTRSTAILLDAGHASSERQGQQRLAESSLAWSHAADTSYALAHSVHQAVAPSDSAWSRPAVMSEWLSHWSAVVPHNVLADNAGGVQP
jgi:hypothetical protein